MRTWSMKAELSNGLRSRWLIYPMQPMKYAFLSPPSSEQTFNRNKKTHEEGKRTESSKTEKENKDCKNKVCVSVCLCMCNAPHQMTTAP
jgi:hypothetical protein